jgi:hypothetical protein
MPNGKKAQLVSIGCEYGRRTRDKQGEDRIDINKIGAKMDRIYNIIVGTLLTIVSGTTIGLLVFWLTHK